MAGSCSNEDWAWLSDADFGSAIEDIPDSPRCVYVLELGVYAERQVSDVFRTLDAALLEGDRYGGHSLGLAGLGVLMFDLGKRPWCYDREHREWSKADGEVTVTEWTLR